MLTILNRLWLIHLEHVNRGASERRDTDEECTDPAKVCRPAVAARLKEKHNASGFWVDPAEIASLVKIATVAGECQVRGSVNAAVLSRHDMFDMKGADARLLLREMAVLAPSACTEADLPPYRGVHPTFFFFRRRRALDFSTVRKWMICT